MKKIFPFVYLLLFLTITSIARAEGVPEIVLANTRSVFYVEAESVDLISSGTAFIVSNGHDGTYLITNYHVVMENPNSVSVWIGDEEKTQATVVLFNEQYDLALLKLSQNVKSAALRLSEGVQQGDAVYAVGFPYAANYLSDATPRTFEEATITNGVVSSIRFMKLVEYGSEVKILQINADINPGNSGGPLMNSEGEVLGVNTFAIKDASGINGAIDASLVVDFINNSGLINVEATRTTSPLNWIALIAGSTTIIVISLFLLIHLKKLYGEKTKTLTLDEFLTRIDRVLTEQDIATLMMPLAIHLREQHNKGSLYLKLSPDKLLITRDGIKVNPSAINSEFVQQNYIAPEQKLNHPVSIETDIFSYCAILKTLLSYTRSSDVSDVPPYSDAETLTKIIRKGMQEDQTKRYRSFQELIYEMAPINLGVTAQIYESQNPKKFIQTKTRSRLHISKRSLIFLFCIFIGVGLFIYQNYQISQLNNHINNHEFEEAQIRISQIIAPNLFIPKQLKYVNAGMLMIENQFDLAYDNFLDLGNYLDAPSMLLEVLYREAARLADSGNFDEAIDLYQEISGYKDSESLVNNTLYRKGVYFIETGNFSTALTIFNFLVKVKYTQADEMIKATNYVWALKYLDEEDYFSAYKKFSLAKGYKDTNSYLSNLEKLIYSEGQKYYRSGNYTKAKSNFLVTGDYLRSTDYLFLISIHLDENISSSDVKNKLIPLISFEDVKDLLLKNTFIAEIFLEGIWSSDQGYFKWEDNSISSNIPSDYYGLIDIIDGIYYVYPKGHYEQKKPDFRFKIISMNTITVYSYKNLRTYTLNRK